MILFPCDRREKDQTAPVLIRPDVTTNPHIIISIYRTVIAALIDVQNMIYPGANKSVTIINSRAACVVTFAGLVYSLASSLVS